MALIRCHECGKEISSLAPACPSCGAPPQSTIAPPPLPAQARPAPRANQLPWGIVALLAGVVLVFAIRGVTHQPNTASVLASPTPATAESGTRSSAPVETAMQSSASPIATETRTAESATASSPPAEMASLSSNPIATETPTAESATRSSPPVENALQSSPSPIATETPNVSEAPMTTAPPPRATYQVVGIPTGDYLNVREGAGSDYHVVTKLEPGTRGIVLGARRVTSGATTWQEITVDGQTGWVNAAYIALEAQVPRLPTESPTAP